MRGNRKGRIREAATDNKELAKAYNVSKSTARDAAVNFFRAIVRKPSACTGAIIMLIFIVMAVVGPMVVDPALLKSDFLNRLDGPSAAHWLGTDHLGRDTLAMTIYGAREVLSVALIASAMTLVIATVVGMVSALTRGWIAGAINLIINLVMTVPSLPVMMLLSSIVEASNTLMFAFVLSIWSWAGLAKAIRAQILSIKNRDYITAARLLDLPMRHIIINEMVPGLTSYLTMNLIFTMRNVISASVTLMFLGMAEFSASHWGMMIQVALGKTGAMYGSASVWYFITPVAAIALFGMGCCFFANGLDEVLNPRLRK